MGRVLEEPRGEGEIYDGGVRLGRAGYRITVYQRTQRVGTFGAPDQEIDGLKEISGIVDPLPPLDINSLILRNADLTLHLADGRCWQFAFTNNQGRAVNTGGDGLK